MPLALTAFRDIDRPVEVVWQRLTDWERAAGWLGVDGVSADGPTAVGTTLVLRTRGKQRRSEIVALEPGQSITLRSRQGAVTADHVYTVEPVDAGARVTLVIDVRTEGAWTLVGPLLRSAIGHADAGQVEALARAVAAG